MDKLKIIGRKNSLFAEDLHRFEEVVSEIVRNSRFLVVGAAGSIGQAVTAEIFKRNPLILHAVDISENNMVELVRTLRSTVGYGSGDFRTYAIDVDSPEFISLCNDKHPYDYIFNLSALKHVRSEKDPYTLMRLIRVNINNSVSIAKIASQHDCKNYFCVSTDKAANPVNMMGASKRIMEQFLMWQSENQNISMARFANVAFSDGSLLHGFNQRFSKQQPISAPSDVRRYFLTPEESGQLCMLSGLLGNNKEIFFPKMDKELGLEKFSDVAIRFIESHGYEPVICQSEDEARQKAKQLISTRKWPLFSLKAIQRENLEEFFTELEIVDYSRFKGIGVIKSQVGYDLEKLKAFESELSLLIEKGHWSKKSL